MVYLHRGPKKGQWEMQHQGRRQIPVIFCPVCVEGISLEGYAVLRDGEVDKAVTCPRGCFSERVTLVGWE